MTGGVSGTVGKPSRARVSLRSSRRRAALGASSGFRVLCGMAFVVASAADAPAAGVSYSLLAHPSLVGRVPGVDGFAGTADDVALMLPGPDDIVGTADDVPANAPGAVSTLRFSQLPFGGDFESFATGAVVVPAFASSAGQVASSDFDVNATIAQTNELTATLIDLDDSPHDLVFGATGAATLDATLLLCIGGATNCLTLRSSWIGAAIRNVPGRGDPFAVPGVDPALASAMQGWKALLSPDWTQLVALRWPTTVLNTLDTGGSIAPFFWGGRASAVLVFQTSDPGLADADGDLVFDAADDCQFTINVDQSDRGGVGSGSLPDGIGDACQCGDVSGDGRVTTADAVVMQRALLVPATATMTMPGLCDVGGQAGCSAADAVILRRALLSPPTALILPRCAPANP
jgi:hypothetical protein